VIAMIVRRRFGALATLATLSILSLVGRPLAAGREGSQPPSSQPAGHIMVAVVRNDGILLPFAAFDGRKWSAPWPFIDRLGGAPELPVNLASVPLDWWGGEAPGAWRLWTRNAQTPLLLTLSSPVMVRIGQSRQLGFRTDQPPVLPPVPPFELPFPKMGLAIAGEAPPLTPIVTISALSPAFKSFGAALRADIDAAEEKTINRIRGRDRWRHPFKREERSAIVPELEAWYVTPLPDGVQRMSYIEAVKKYPVKPEDEGCGLETFVSGWIHHDETRKKPQSTLKAVVSYCDRRGVSYMLPFGQMLIGGRTHWIVQMSGRDHEWYAVVEGGPNRTRYVAEYQAGWAALDR